MLNLNENDLAKKFFIGILGFILLMAVLYPFPTISEGEEHRKWSWADEQSWNKHFILPYSDAWTKHGSNPIFTVGVAGKWDDLDVRHPSTIKVGDTYYLYYCGDGDGGIANRQIGLATSTDGVSFTRVDVVSGEPGLVLQLGAGGTYDDNALLYPSVIYDTYESDPDYRWKMLYDAHDGAIRTQGGAYSANGLNWTRYPTAPFGKPANWVQGTTVIKMGAVYFGYYERNDNDVGLMTSPDFTTWTEYGEVLARGAAAEWDDNRLTHLSAFWSLGVTYISYTGFSGVNPEYKIGFAVSGNGWDFTKFILNPVLEGVGGTWEAAIQRADLIMVEDKFVMFYSGVNPGVTDNVIGRADLP